MEKVFKSSFEYGIEKKKTLKRCKFGKTTFHGSSLRNG
jgi:hypothetical protein